MNFTRLSYDGVTLRCDHWKKNQNLKVTPFCETNE